LKRMFLAGAALLIPSLAGCTQMEQRRLEAAVMNKPAPDFTLPALDGGTVRLADYRGKPVVLAFWAYG